MLLVDAIILDNQVSAQSDLGEIRVIGRLFLTLNPIFSFQDPSNKLDYIILGLDRVPRRGGSPVE